MTITEAKSFLGKYVHVRFTDRTGASREAYGKFVDLEYIPMYGTNLMFDFGDVALDKVTAIVPRVDDIAA